MRFLLSLFLLCLGGVAFADIVVPTRTIRAQQVIGPGDVKLHSGEASGAFSMTSEVIGLEARVALYPGRPVRLGDVGAPAVVARNQLVALVYDRSGLIIRTEGRALDRAGAGELVKVMNLASRATLIGRVQADGSISVSE